MRHQGLLRFSWNAAEFEPGSHTVTEGHNNSVPNVTLFLLNAPLKLMNLRLLDGNFQIKLNGTFNFTKTKQKAEHSPTQITEISIYWTPILPSFIRKIRNYIWLMTPPPVTVKSSGHRTHFCLHISATLWFFKQILFL